LPLDQEYLYAWRTAVPRIFPWDWRLEGYMHWYWVESGDLAQSQIVERNWLTIIPWNT
jgi:hypothetical protein